MIYYEIIEGSINGDIFLEFTKKAIKKLSKERNYIIIDNARIHHYAKFKKYINRKKNIIIIYNIPYSPEMNPIEHIFKDIKKYLKDKIINNDNIIDEINKSFSSI